MNRGYIDVTPDFLGSFCDMLPTTFQIVGSVPSEFERVVRLVLLSDFIENEGDMLTGTVTVSGPSKTMTIHKLDANG